MTTVPTTTVPDAAIESARAGTLAAVPRLLRGDPALAALIGAADATVAVPEAAQAVVAAALAAFTQRAPLLVITATGLDAERLGDDLSCLIDPDDGSDKRGSDLIVGALAGPVVVLPAWETLPFERVSPETETMGRRLAVLHALTGAADPTLPPPPRVIVAPVRAILQRLGPLQGTAPIVIHPGQQVDVGELLPELVAMGYRREHQVEHRGEFAVRGGIVDVFPSTADAPVRIDLWGDEVDRLTAFSVSDQRSSHDLRAVALYGCRELVVHARRCANAAAALVTRRPWGASVWENLAEGAQFDGMESWLPFLDDAARVLPDLLPDGAQVVLVEPRRIRDRGVQLLDEEAALAETLAATWGAKEGDEETFPRLHVPFERLLSECAAGVTALPPVPEGPDMAALTVRRFDPVAGDPARLAAGVTGLVGQGYSVALCAATAAGAGRLSAALAAEGVHAPVLDGRAGHGGGLRGGRADHQRLHPARGQGRSPLGDRRHRPARPAPPGPSPGAGGRRLLRRPGGREFRGAPPARCGALRRRDDEDHGRDDPRLLDFAVPGFGPPVPPRRADRGHHALQRGRVTDALEDGRFGLAEDPGQGARRRQ